MPLHEKADGLTGSAGDEFECSNGRTRLPGLDQENRLTGKIRPRQLRHAQAGVLASTPYEAGVDLHTRGTPAWLTFSRCYGREFILPSARLRNVKPRGALLVDLDPGPGAVGQNRDGREQEERETECCRQGELAHFGASW